MRMFAKIVLAASVLALTSGAFGAQKTVTVFSNTTLNGQPVAAGDYKVDYDIHGSTADVKFLHGKKVVATAMGQVVEAKAPYKDTAIIRSNNPDGSSSIVQLQLARETSAIRFETEGSVSGR